MKEKYYLDTCIWLNLLKKEGDSSKGKPYWKIAKEFIQKIVFSENKEIIYSGFVIKELRYKLEELNMDVNKLLFLKKGTKFKFVKAKSEDYLFARELEKRYQDKLSFYDYLHIAVCKRIYATLITRDYEMIKVAKIYIVAGLPEQLL